VIVDALCETKVPIRDLTLDRNRIGSGSCESFVRLLKRKSTLHYLNLNPSSFTYSDTSRFVDTLKHINYSLRALDTGFREDYIELLCEINIDTKRSFDRVM